MAVSFSRTTRALEADRGVGARMLLLVGLALFAAWTGWFLLGRVTLYEVSRSARVEVVSATRAIAVEHGGRLIASGLYVGRRVKAGEILAELDSSAERLRLAEAEARLASFPTRMAALKQALASARAAQGSAQSSAQAAVSAARAQTRAADAEASFNRDLAERQRRDSETGGTAPVDAARASSEAHKALALRDAAASAEARTAAESRSLAESRSAAVADLSGQLAALASEWTASQAMVDQLRRELDASKVRAPADGVIGDVAALRLDDMIAPGTRLATIVPAEDLRVVGEFDAARGLGRLAEGQTARLRLAGFAWTQYGDFPAKVERVGAEPNGGLLRVELRLPRPGLAELPLRHGMSGQVDVAVDRVSPAVLFLRVLGEALT